MVLLSNEKLVFDRLELLLEELPQFERVVFDFFLEEEEFFVEIFEVLAENGVKLFDLF